MLNLPQKTLDNIKKLLLKQQREVAEDIKEVEKDDPVKGDGLVESSEPGTDSWIAEGHARVVALGDQLTRLGGDVRVALGKIRNGTYGHCEKCKKHIETTRLLVMPTAKLCLKCSKSVKR